MKPAQFSDITCSITVCAVYSVLLLPLERKGWTLPALTNTFTRYSPSLQLMSLIIPNNVWWPVARRAIAQNVESHQMNEED